MTFYQTITAAIQDIAANGYDSQKRIAGWVVKIRQAAARDLVSKTLLERTLRQTLAQVYRGLVANGGALKYHSGVSRFTLQHLNPKMRVELDKRIVASANLITLNREQAIDKTLQRFQGWATSVPAGGSKATDKPEAKDAVKKAMKQLPFEERRVLIDQGHKLTASVNAVIAENQNAIAAVWHSNWRQHNYDYREDHKARDGEVYLIKGSWAQAKGLVKPGKAGYLNDITQPAEEPFCRCHASYIYALRNLPKDMITQKGRDELERVRKLIDGA